MERGNAFPEILEPSASESGSSTPPKRRIFDVFISHRGLDSRETVAASIFNTLKPIGAEVYIVGPVFEYGDFIPSEIQNAITSSFLHIPIVSPRYAESPRCLEELSLMLKTGHKIIPIFDKVHPADIRWMKGTHAEGFSKLGAKKRYTPQKLAEWKQALQQVSFFKGFIVENENDEEMLKTIKSYVLKHAKKIPFAVAKHPVGLDETLQDFERSVLGFSENAKIVGITGMGGLGKTTLAEEYFNRKMHSFFRHSFVSNVRDGSLHIKQEKMFQDLGGPKNISFDSVEEGKLILTNYLRSRHVLIILDDVDHPDQLDYLLPMKDNLGQGSRIVITSRNSDVLMSWGMLSNSIYKMKALSPPKATELFCRHAFLQPSPLNGTEDLVQRIVNVCKGFPLSLKIIGGSLAHRKDKKYCYGQLHNLSRLFPGAIKSLLKVSIDELNEEEKEIFMDIACFFIGTEIHSAITLWDESGWNGERSLQTLLDKCLVEVDKSNCLRMHDELRDLGREISMTSSPYRLWSPQLITHIIEKQGKESLLIRGIKSSTDELNKKLLELARGSSGSSKWHPKILNAENSCFTEELATVIAAPVWARWFTSPFTDIPSRILLNRLRVLELSHASKLEQLWHETANPLMQLRYLKVKSCSKVRNLPTNFAYCRNLQHIYFSDCPDFTFPPEILAKLPRLSHMDVSNCYGFRELLIQKPGFSSSLFSLKSATLKESHVSRISISTECCPALEHIVLDGNRYLAEIDSLPISVKNLRIKECGMLEKIGGLENCRSLETLMVHTSRTVPLVQSLKHMESLKSVSLAAAGYISSFEPCIQTLNRKKWPSLCTICGSAVPGVEAVVNSYTFPGLTLVHSLDRWKDTDNWKYVFQRERSSNEAAMICLVIESTSDAMTLHMACIADKSLSLTRVKEGRWVFIGVFTGSSLVGDEVLFFLSAAGVTLEDDSVEMGMLAMGEENRVVDAFYKLLQCFGKVSETQAEIPKLPSSL